MIGCPIGPKTLRNPPPGKPGATPSYKVARSKKLNNYPAEMHQAIRAAWNSPEGVRIPTSSPSALRLSFYGLFGAYRKNNQPEIVDGLSIYLTEDGIRIGRSVEDQFSAEIRAALEAHQKPAEAPKQPEGWDDAGEEIPDHVAAARAMLERLGARK